MDFRIADTFTDSLGRPTGEEQKAVKTTALDLQMNPASPGMSSHKLDKAKDKNFWSVRVNGDICIIVHKTAGSLLLCYVNHHVQDYFSCPTDRCHTLKGEINAEAWATLNSDTSWQFAKPKQGRIALKVINHQGDELMKVFRV